MTTAELSPDRLEWMTGVATSMCSSDDPKNRILTWAATCVTDPDVFWDRIEPTLSAQIEAQAIKLAADRRQRQLDKAVENELLRREVTRLADSVQHPPQPMPAARSLTDRLSVKRSPIVWRIVGWMKQGFHVLLAAQYKAGKTTLVINVIRALVDGVPFLDKFDVAQARIVTLLDFEMAEEEPNQLDEWYEAAHIKNTDRVKVVALRGRASSFNILDPEVRVRWASQLRAAGTDVLVLDCLRPVLDALGLEEARDAGKFYVAFDALLHEAGIRDAIVVTHMGHQNERARGDSRNLDWPDANWTLVRESDDPASKRFIKAFGRGVDVPETALTFNPKTHRMAIGHGSRRDTKVEEAITAILAFVQKEANPPTQLAVRTAVKADGFTDDAIRQALKIAVKRGDLLEAKGGLKNTKIYSIPTSGPDPF